MRPVMSMVSNFEILCFILYHDITLLRVLFIVHVNVSVRPALSMFQICVFMYLLPYHILCF